jgi:hypothetical protein
MLVIGSEDSTPRHLPVRAPSFDPLPEGEKAPMVTGHFAFDLGQIAGFTTTPQTYFLYAFSRDYMVGPILTAIVTEDMLPPGAI